MVYPFTLYVLRKAREKWLAMTYGEQAGFLVLLVFATVTLWPILLLAALPLWIAIGADLIVTPFRLLGYVARELNQVEVPLLKVFQRPAEVGVVLFLGVFVFLFTVPPARLVPTSSLLLCVFAIAGLVFVRSRSAQARERSREQDEAEQRRAEQATEPAAVPPPPTAEQRAAQARERYEATLRMLDKTPLDNTEKRAAQEHAKQKLLREMSEVLR